MSRGGGDPLHNPRPTKDRPAVSYAVSVMEYVSVGVAEGEHGWHAWPAENFIRIDAGGREGRVGGLGVVDGEDF